MPDEDVRERLKEAVRANQEPKDRIWAVIIVLGILVFALGGLLIETRLYLAEGRELGFQRGAVDCLDVLTDDTRPYGLPGYCTDPHLIVYYPNRPYQSAVRKK
jgi:hypothetical protein